MVDTTPLPAGEQVSAESDYRPLAALSIIGLCLAVFFAVFILVNVLVGWVRGTPFTVEAWFLIFPLTGAVVSYLAQRQIRNSEGTRAGMALATSGLWISVLFGLGYAAYMGATNFALRKQAEDFLTNPETGFLAKLKDPAQVNAAFLMIVPPDLRENINPEDERRMQKVYQRRLDDFRSNPIVGIVRQGGPGATEYRTKSVRWHGYREGGFWVEVDVEFRTPEVVCDYPFVVRSREGPGGRDWYVDWTKTSPKPLNLRFTEEGEALWNLRQHSHEFAVRWISALRAGGRDAVLKGTCRTADFAPGGKGVDVAALKDAEKREFLRKCLDELLGPSAGEKPRVEIYFTCCTSQLPGRQPNPFQAGWQVNKDSQHVQIAHVFYIGAFEGKNKLPKAFGTGKLVVERTNAKGLAVSRGQTPKWCVVRLEVTSLEDPLKSPLARNFMMAEGGG